MYRQITFYLDSVSEETLLWDIDENDFGVINITEGQKIELWNAVEDEDKWNQPQVPKCMYVIKEISHSIAKRYPKVSTPIKMWYQRVVIVSLT